MDTASKAADAASLKIHFELEDNDSAALHKTLDEVRAYETQHRGSAGKEFNAQLSNDLKDVLPQMSLMWAQDHQSDLATYSNDSGNITRQGIADYDMATAHDHVHSPLDNMMADSLRQNLNNYSNAGDDWLHQAWDYLDNSHHVNGADIDAALAPMQSAEDSRLAVSQVANHVQAHDSLFRKLSEDGDGRQITPDSLRNALANNDPRFMNNEQRASAQYLADHYADFDKYSGGSSMWNPGFFPDPVSGQYHGSWYEHFSAPITPEAINQYSTSTFDQPADQIVRNTEKAERFTAGTTRRRNEDSASSGDETLRGNDSLDRSDNYRYDGAPPAVPKGMYEDARVQDGEGFYQAAQRMLGANASADEVLSLSHEFKSEYARDNNGADPSGLPVGYNFLDGYNKSDWNNLVSKYPSLTNRSQDQAAPSNNMPSDGACSDGYE